MTAQPPLLSGQTPCSSAGRSMRGQPASGNAGPGLQLGAELSKSSRVWRGEALPVLPRLALKEATFCPLASKKRHLYWDRGVGEAVATCQEGAPRGAGPWNRCEFPSTCLLWATPTAADLGRVRGQSRGQVRAHVRGRPRGRGGCGSFTRLVVVQRARAVDGVEGGEPEVGVCVLHTEEGGEEVRGSGVRGALLGQLRRRTAG